MSIAGNAVVFYTLWVRDVQVEVSDDGKEGRTLVWKDEHA